VSLETYRNNLLERVALTRLTLQYNHNAAIVPCVISRDPNRKPNEKDIFASTKPGTEPIFRFSDITFTFCRKIPFFVHRNKVPVSTNPKFGLSSPFLIGHDPPVYLS
jgi:hypothetical protein